MKRRLVVGVVLLIAIASGCSKNNKATLGLDVDLYLHPTSADPVDIILQTAITKRLNDNSLTRLSSIHVRVEDRAVILTGITKADVKDAAERIATQTELTLNGESIRPKQPITNRITLK